MSTTDTASRIETDNAIVELVRLNDLYIDRRFQRVLSDAFVSRLVDKFDKNLVGVLDVNMRADGTLSLIDGQHRREALLHLGWTETLCLIHDLTLEQEADRFVKLQRERLHMHAAEVFKAAVFAGEPRAVAIAAIVEAHGFQVSKSNTTAGCISSAGALQKVYEQYGARVLTDTIATIRIAWGIADGRARTGLMIRGLGQFLAAFQTLDREALATQLEILPASSLIRRSHGIREGSGGDQSTAMARAILEHWNRGKTTTKRLAASRLGKGTTSMGSWGEQ